ncbi:hypothetical protein [Nocardioides acrostichi]|uniref:Uncharacterized protein n=1 Tax=Nocardioides acrostichi TaxID=2784339 RepID=A0A930Y7U5_9ACTN|nr:hypothetical protein [Nocardioides acrostichi]MBF4162412.1 hypothetical protein [Nocardioides acrostichi]
MSPIDSWDGATAVFTGAGDVPLDVLFVVVAFAMFIGFLVTMVRHENHAYEQMIAHTAVEKGPAVEGEPSAY